MGAVSTGGDDAVAEHVGVLFLQLEVACLALHELHYFLDVAFGACAGDFIAEVA